MAVIEIESLGGKFCFFAFRVIVFFFFFNLLLFLKKFNMANVIFL